MATYAPQQITTKPNDIGMGVEGAVFVWLGANKQRLLEAQALGYGYEGWLQVELGMALQRHFQAGTWQLSREVSIYEGNDRRKCDLYGKSLDVGRVPMNIGFELKSESQRQSLSAAAGFLKGFGDDMQRIRYKLYQAARPTAMYCFAFTTTNPTTLAFDAPTYYITENTAPGTVHMMWYRFDHPKAYTGNNPPTVWTGEGNGKTWPIVNIPTTGGD